MFAELILAAAILGESVEIARSETGTDVWYAYPTTLVATSDKYAFMVENRTKTNKTQVYISIDSKTCAVGNGNLYGRFEQKTKWFVLDVVDIHAQTRVSSIIASVLCSVGDERSRKNFQKMT